MTTITCEQVRPLLSAQLDGDLPEAQAAAVKEHVASCPKCQSRRQALQRLSELFSPIDMAIPPAGFTGRVMSRLGERESTSRSLGRSLFPAYGWSAGAAVLTLIVVIVVMAALGFAGGAGVSASRAFRPADLAGQIGGAASRGVALVEASADSALLIGRVVPPVVSLVALFWLLVAALATAVMLASLLMSQDAQGELVPEIGDDR